MTANGRSRVLVWQWGRFGGAPRFATLLAEGLAELPDVNVILSLSRDAEILRQASPPRCDLPIETYTTLAGFLTRAITAPFSLPGLIRLIRELGPDIAVCAQPGPLDLMMAAALRWLRIPFFVLVHDADAHPGDGFPMQMWLQRSLCRQANTVAALTAHVGDRLLRQKLAGTPGRPLVRLRHPPMHYAFAEHHDPDPGPARGTFRLLLFGRLLPYKGLDLFADSLGLLGSNPALSVRVVGSGPESRALSVLRGLPGVTVENRWVPEAEVGALFSWADAVVLPYREASQSGVAAVALAARRYVVATNVGGLAEQLSSENLAILCEPDAASFATGLRLVLDRQRSVRSPPILDGPLRDGPIRDAQGQDAIDGWREIGRSLLDQTHALSLARQHRTRPAPFRHAGQLNEHPR
ncbi:MAG: glycosyltransferase [Acetobacteraceae bacterium]|jgi:glycosyltransferase involved in cell wall biosynthesis